MFRTIAIALPVVALSLLPVAADRAAAQTQGGGTLPPLAERAPEIAEMLEALRLYEILAVMATEGVEGALSLERDMFPDAGGAAWAAEANRIHGADRIISLFEDAFPVEAMTDADVARITAFFTSSPGADIAAAELAARAAFLDPGTEELANEAFRDAVAEEAPRLDVLTEFIEANDLIERNVSGALNSNFAFYRGLSDGGAFDVEVPEELMLAEVWAQEPEIRRDTIEWLYSFQLMAYSAVEDADIEAYTELSLAPAGQALNAALFEAFDTLFNRLSYEMGAAAAGFIAGEDA